MTVYDVITDRILKELEAGVIPWIKPWKGGFQFPLRSNGQPYRGINVWLLPQEKFTSRYWLTFKQMEEFGGHLKVNPATGHTDPGNVVVYWKFPGPKEIAKAQDEGKKAYPVIRYYRVWNLEQTEGCKLPERMIEKPSSSAYVCPLDAGQEIVQRWVNTGDAPTIKIGGSRACYNPATDTVTVPELQDFTLAEEYYCTLFHELGHATGHATRLNRPGITSDSAFFGSHTYGEEELVAEFAAAFLAGAAGIEAPVIKNVAAYINAWKAEIEADHRLVVFAAQRGQKAADSILGKAAIVDAGDQID